MGDAVKLAGSHVSSHRPYGVDAVCDSAADFYRIAREREPIGRHFDIESSFELAGVWGGVADFLESLWAEILSTAPDLVARHNYELATVAPWLTEDAFDIKKTLTDTASELERVRSYSADRATRIPHAIIDFIIAFKRRSAPHEIWVLNCHDVGSAGPMAQLFYSILSRRSAPDAAVKLVLGVRLDQREATAEKLFRSSSVYGPAVIMLRSRPRGDLAASAPTCGDISLEKDLFARLDDASSAELIRRLPGLLAPSGTSGRTLRNVKLRLFALSYYCAAGFYPDALRYADRLLEDGRSVAPGDTQLHWMIAYKTLNALLGAGNIDQALKLATTDCQVLVESAGSRMQSNLLYLRAMIHARFQQPRDLALGEKLLAEALSILQPQEMEPSDYHFAHVFVANGIAMIRVFQGRRQEALALCQQGMEEMDRYVEAASHLLHRSVLVYNAAQVYSSLGETDRAIEHLTRAIAMDPNYSEYYNDRGNLHMMRGEYGEASRDYETAIALGPPYHEVLVNLGQCCKLQDRHLEALSHYDRALDIRPDVLLARIGRAFCLHQLGRFDEALAEYDSILQRDASMWEIFSNRASLYYEVDRLDRALEDMDEAIRLNPHMPELAANRELILAAARGIAS